MRNEKRHAESMPLFIRAVEAGLGQPGGGPSRPILLLWKPALRSRYRPARRRAGQAWPFGQAHSVLRTRLSAKNRLDLLL